MTAATLPTGQQPRAGARAAAVPWRRLVRVTARQHRTGLLWAGLLAALLGIALAATGATVHHFAGRHRANWEFTTTHGHGALLGMQAFSYLLQFIPVLAGMFVGAPLVAREAEHGTARLAWTQAASRTRWLLAQVVPIACLLGLAAAGLGAEFGWYLSPFPEGHPWSPPGFRQFPMLFNLSPLPLVGWAVLGLTFGVFAGAAIRRTLPAMALTLACYSALWYEVSASWRMHYLPPLHHALTVHFSGSAGNTSSFGGYWSGRAVILSQGLGWPDGRSLGNAAYGQSGAWLNLHHIVLWVTYQPASRYHEFQFIELGWLIAASALLLAGTAVLIRRRPA
jgi:hypothetical protein